MEALETYYGKQAQDVGGELVRMKIFRMVGQWGIPVVFALFAGAYWSLGMNKYFSG